jgi:hypothetical protein
MLRRDFLKFLSLAVPTAALPVTVKGSSEESKVPKITDNGVNHTIDVDFIDPSGDTKDKVELKFDFDDTVVKMESYDGSFSFTERLNFPERGVLGLVPEHEPVDFELNLYVHWLSDPDFKKKIHGSKKFDLTVIIDGTTYTLKDVYWSQMSWDEANSAFSLAGVVNNVGT